MKLSRTQIYLDPEVKDMLKLYAESKRVSLAEIIRQEIKKLTRIPIVQNSVQQYKRKSSKHPLFELCGIVAGPRDASRNIDQIYDEA